MSTQIIVKHLSPLAPPGDLIKIQIAPTIGKDSSSLADAIARAESSAAAAAVSESNASDSEASASADATSAGQSAASASSDADAAASSESSASNDAARAESAVVEATTLVSEYLGMMSESEARAINRINEAKYDASGMVHMGKAYDESIASTVTQINEGIWSTMQVGNENTISIGRATNSQAGTSKTEFAVTHIAGAVSNVLTESSYTLFKFTLPPAPDGTRIYDSTGDARGSGEASLDLKVDVDPRHGDVAPDLATAVNRAFCELNGETPDGLGGTYDTATHVIVSGTGSKGASWNPYYGSKEDISKTYSYEIVLKSIDATRMRVQASASTTSTAELLHDEPVIAGEQKVFKGTFQPDQTTTPTPLAGLHISSYSGESLELVSLQFKVATEEVVTHPVDLIGLEYYEEELTGRQEVFECIQSLSTTFGTTSVPTVLSTRKLSYFQQYDGQFPEVTANPDFINDRYRCVVWDDLTDPQKREVAAYMGEKLFMGVNGFPVNGRLRARTIRGAGNGNWENIDSNTTLELAHTRSSKGCTPAQGIKDVVPPSNWNASFVGTYSAHSAGNFAGVFQARERTTAYQGRCFLYVVATVPRANKGAYHPDLNPWGCSKWYNLAQTATRNWYQDDTYQPINEQECFGEFVAIGTGSITSGKSGHPDGIFYDGIYDGGLNGVIDWRLGAVANDSPEEAAKVEAKVENGTYRGLEKLVWSEVKAPLITGSNKILLRADGSNASVSDIDVTVPSSAGGRGSVPVNGAVYKIDGGVVTDVSDRLWGFDDVIYISQSDFPDTAIAVIRYKTNLSVSGEFNTQMVIGDPANILLTDALKDGWLGTWGGLSDPSGNQELPRKSVSSTGTRIFTDDNGVTWNQSVLTINTTLNTGSMAHGSSARIWIADYKAFAKQTKPSTNKLVYNAKAGLMGVFVNNYNAPNYGGLLTETFIGKVSTGAGGTEAHDTMTLLSKDIDHLGNMASDLSGSIFSNPIHAPLHITAPANNSPTVKVLPYQISNNGQASIGYQANELTWGSPTYNSAQESNTTWTETERYVVTSGSMKGHYRCNSSFGYALTNGDVFRDLKGDIYKGATGVRLLQYLGAAPSSWGDDSTIKVTADGSDTFVDLNGNTNLSVVHELAIPCGWTSNHARPGTQVDGVDL